MKSKVETSAIDFTRMWRALFVGDDPEIKKAIRFFDPKATIILPSLPYRLTRDEDEEEILFSHLSMESGESCICIILPPKRYDF